MPDQGTNFGLLAAVQPQSYTMATLPSASALNDQIIEVTDIGGVGLGLMWSDGSQWRTIPFAAQRIRTQTAADGTFTWNYPTPFATGTVPKISVVAEAPAGSTDVYNAQTDGAPTNTQCKVRVTRTQQSVVSLLGLTILSIPASVGATFISILAFN